MTRLAASILWISIAACSSRSPATTASAPVATAATTPSPAPRAPAPDSAPAVTPEPAPAPAPEPAPRSAPIRITATDGLPADLVGEHPLWDVASDPVVRSALFGTRVYPDGRVYRYSAFRSVVGADGEWTTVDAPAAWHLIARVRPRSLAEVERRIRKRIAAGLPGPVTLAPDQGHRSYRAWVDGREHLLLVQLARPNGAYYLMATLVTPIESAILDGSVPVSAP